MRIALLNPNTTETMTVAMAAVARAVLPPDVEVTPFIAPRGPDAIEGYEEQAVAAAVVCEMMRLNPGFDAYLIACFGDPGLYPARELTRAPVVGIGQAAYHAACTLGRRFAVLTTLERGIASIEDRLIMYGLRDRCAAIRPTGVPVLGHGSGGEGLSRLCHEARCAVEENGADTIVLACGSMAGEAEAVAEAAAVPVVDGMVVGALQAYSLVRAGLWTSKRGAFSPPEPVGYSNMPSAYNRV
jgi:allantoin racemase